MVSFDRRTELTRIQTPTLLLTGDQDNLAPPSMMGKMAGKITDSRFQCLAGAGHLASLEQTEKFNEVVLEFSAGIHALQSRIKIYERSS